MKVYHLELPPLCNQACEFCIISAKRRIAPLNLDVFHFLKMVDSETERGDTVFIAGGEPTYWNNIEVLFRAILKMGRKAYVVTNGSNPDRLSGLIGAGMEQAVFSFFAFDEAIHTKITGAPYFPKLIESLSFFHRNGKDIHINFIVNADNQGRILQDVRTLVAEYVPAAVTFQLLIPMGKGAEVRLPDLASASEEVNRAVSFLRTTGTFIRTSFFPHCLIRYHEHAEDYSASQDSQRKDFAVKSAHVPLEKCSKCSRLSACKGLPSGYDAEVFPFS